MPYVVLDMLGRRFGGWFATDIETRTRTQTPTLTPTLTPSLTLTLTLTPTLIRFATDIDVVWSEESYAGSDTSSYPDGGPVPAQYSFLAK
eukprot:scaffold52228_cov35-Phaeocystis_antarctica.AAC.1